MNQNRVEQPNGWGKSKTSTMDSSSGHKSSREMRTSMGGTHGTVTDDTRDADATTLDDLSTSGGLKSPPGSDDNRASMRDLSFDLEQPWQRSLMRELENIEASMPEDKHARARSRKILLGHAQGGDFLLEYDEADDDTIVTEASSSMPIRSQAIHRQMLNAPHSSLFVDDEDYGALSTDSSADPFALLDSTTLPSVHRGRGANISLEPSSAHVREGRDSGREDIAKSTPTPIGLSRANALIEERAAYLKKTSSSRLGRKMSEETADIPVSSCMCIGYNFLDFLIPSDLDTIQGRHKKRRTSRSIHSSSASRRSMLGPVSEEDAPESFFHSLGYDTSSSNHVAVQAL